MKKLITLFLFIFSNYSYAVDYNIYKYKDKYIYVPNNEKKELEGVGMTFSDKLVFETYKDETGQDKKRAYVWIKGCGKTYIEDEKILKEKEGLYIRVRMSEFGKCSVKSWEKF